jgi:nicotinamide-nucleotide amidase
MVEGAMKFSAGDVSVAVTGVAGPGGGTGDKPVGLVHFAAAMKGSPTIVETRRFGNIGRLRVRQESIEVALNLLLRRIG